MRNFLEHVTLLSAGAALSISIPTYSQRPVPLIPQRDGVVDDVGLVGRHNLQMQAHRQQREQQAAVNTTDIDELAEPRLVKRLEDLLDADSSLAQGRVKQSSTVSSGWSARYQK